MCKIQDIYVLFSYISRMYVDILIRIISQEHYLNYTLYLLSLLSKLNKLRKRKLLSLNNFVYIQSKLREKLIKFQIESLIYGHVSHLNFLKFCVKVNDTLTTNTKAKKTTKLTLTRTPHVDSSIIYLFIYLLLLNISVHKHGL